MQRYGNIYDDMISPESLFAAWNCFKAGKTKREDVANFEWRLEQNIFALHRDLRDGIYRHGPYSSFFITDPKQRHIHKATVRDRVVHHAVFQVLNPTFEPTFIANSYSCRVGKGTHKGVEALTRMVRKTSKNYTVPCFVLKCDVRKFFDSIDHHILLETLGKRIVDPDVMRLLEIIVRSFPEGQMNLFERKGVPIGNLTSQLFANVYMNVFDQFMKNECRVKHYARYTDDFVVVSASEDELVALLPKIQSFLRDRLRLELHPKKVTIRQPHQGIDFLGYVIRPHSRVLRTKTKRRMLKKLARQTEACNAETISAKSLRQTMNSYLGVLSHANAHGLSEKVTNDTVLGLIPPRLTEFFEDKK